MIDPIALWPGPPPHDVKAFADAPDEVPILIPFPITEGKPKACVVVCPGGGYHMRAAHEGEPVARWLNSLGIAAAVLHYRVKRRFPAALRDAERGIRLVRHHAKAWNMDPGRVGILGFSAGGHLAASAVTLGSLGEATAADPIDRLRGRPDLGILCYAVTTAFDGRHAGSITVLLGNEPWDAAAATQVSLERQVGPETPPCFLWHTADDAGVPVVNSTRFAEACAAAKVPVELHVYPKGRHGLGLASDDPIVGRWREACAGWLSDNGFR